jgi:hypothetical protein
MKLGHPELHTTRTATHNCKRHVDDIEAKTIQHPLISDESLSGEIYEQFAVPLSGTAVIRWTYPIVISQKSINWSRNYFSS